MKASAWLIGVFIVVLCAATSSVDGLHLRGTWRTTEFYHFLVKFSFQRTNQHDRSNTQGYIYGNITSKENVTTPVTFVVVDKSFFFEYYGNRSRTGDNDVCQSMFRKIDTIAFDATCFKDNKEDFLRRVPCPTGSLCIDEDQPQAVVPGYQFTYGVQDINQPRFWYVSMVACQRVNCTWIYDANLDVTLDYDIWLVNGNPYTDHHNPFKYQFSFDRQDLIEIYLVFLVLYLGLLCVQTYVAIQQRHAITHLFTAAISFALLAHVLHLAHYVQFSADGEGETGLEVTGDVFDIVSQLAFVLVLLLLAKGWAVSHREPKSVYLLLLIWFCYLFSSIVLYAWGQTKIDVVEDIDLYMQTWPGRYSVILRLVVMFWFLYELRLTMQQERSKCKLQFLLHFGASSLVWFIYLLVLAVVAINMSALWRFKFVIGISSSVNFLAFASMTHLLWPVKHESYMHLNNITVGASDELEEFNEAPHVVNQFVRHERT